VKVQRPGIRDTIHTDLEALGELASLADDHTEAGHRYSFTAVLSEFRAAMLVGSTIVRKRKNLNALASRSSTIERPRTAPDLGLLTTERVLTMEYVKAPTSRISHRSPREADRRGLLEGSSRRTCTRRW
jgi:ubiquinone biosynthesis protein